jgi:hypothetical protein
MGEVNDLRGRCTRALEEQFDSVRRNVADLAARRTNAKVITKEFTSNGTKCRVTVHPSPSAAERSATDVRDALAVFTCLYSSALPAKPYLFLRLRGVAGDWIIPELIGVKTGTAKQNPRAKGISSLLAETIGKNELDGFLSRFEKVSVECVTYTPADDTAVVNVGQIQERFTSVLTGKADGIERTQAAIIEYYIIRNHTE